MEQAFIRNHLGRTEQARRDIERLIRRACPPLELRDALALAHLRFACSAERHMLPDGPVDEGNDMLCRTLAASVLYRAAEDHCREARLLPPKALGFAFDGEFRYLVGRLDAWHGEVLDPAKNFVFNNLGPIVAGDRRLQICVHWRLIRETFAMRTDPRQIRDAIATANESLHYENPFRAPAESKALADRAARVWGEWVTDGRMNAFFKKGDELSLGWRQVRDAAEKKHGSGGKLVGLPSSDLKTPKGDPVDPGDWDDNQTPPPPDLVALRELCDLRDKLEAFPMLRDFAAELQRLRAPVSIDHGVNVVRNLLDLLGSVNRQPLQAAILYIWWRRVGGQPKRSRKRVAVECGTTPNAARRLEGDAERLLASRGLLKSG